MTEFLDGIANWFQSVGVHPVLGAFLAGVVIAFMFAYRRSPPEELRAGAAGARPIVAAGAIGSAKAGSAKLTVDGRTVEFSAEVIAHLRNGDKIEAIKALRGASGLGLKEAKEAVEALAESPVMRQ